MPQRQSHPQQQHHHQHHHQQTHHHPQQQQQQQLHQMSQNQWPSGMRPTSHIPHQAPQHQHYQHHQQAWPNGQIHHSQAFSNGASAMGGFNMPYLSQQMIQDAFALSAPVEASDEKLLLQALLDSRDKKETYKDALNGLHGKNGHSSSLWKDYYLDHKDRLDEWITVYLNPPKMVLQTIKRPSPSAYKTEDSPVMPPRAPPKTQKRSKPTTQTPQPLGGRRSTINSLTAPAPVYGDRLPAPNAEITIPEPPSRSPSPPTIIIPHRGRGNKYTPEDREFFLKFISWRLKGDPTLTRNDLCTQLAEKAPHHTSQSWASYWSNKHDVPDKILAAAKGEDYDEDEPDSEKEEKISVRRRPKYRDPSSDEDDEDDSENDSDGVADEESDDDNEPIKAWTENEMGQKGGPFTDADLYITAKYVASFPNFDEISSKDRWQPFHEKFPNRSAKSWAEYFRRNERRTSLPFFR
ncbi:hypothetical protein BDZ94DRAFT_1166308 [Collybia nuda]|uniref:Uncharacterized protein n=1 Tax=Collybia nuda TaxID=64659 RepID=A0A9P5Y4H2_9AGAR|nr:hypothetical protein BDZ94DRAFT_1166308 [Collybia nuda]